MTSFRIVLLVVSHGAALGLGALVASSGGDSGEPVRSTVSSKTERLAREVRKVSVSDLLDAYRGDSPHWGQANERRAERRRAAMPPETLVEPQSRESPDERAAKVSDFAATMQERVEMVDQGKGYDHWFCRAVIRRWLAEEPEVCMAWLGRMEMHTGWVDPFDELAKSALGADPGRIVRLLDDGWLERNRRYALESLSKRVGEDGVDQLEAILEGLRESERERFLTGAIGHARAEEVGRWLEVIGPDDEGRMKALADQCLGPSMGMMGIRWVVRDGVVVPSSGKQHDEWLHRGEKVMAAVAGTPAEELFRARWERELRAREQGRLRVLMGTDPKQALDLMVQMRVDSGEDPEEARRAVTNPSTGNIGSLETWGRLKWEVALQGVVLGERGIDAVLAERFGEIAGALPPELQNAVRGNAVRDALVVSPGDTTAYLLEHGRAEDLKGPLQKVVGQYSRTHPAKAAVLRDVIENGGWDAVPGMHQVATRFVESYRQADRARAEDWIATLPAEVVGELKGGTP